jgi:argininosuccinate lyase
MKLWQKTDQQTDNNIEEKIRQFTVGSDLIFDVLLAEADVNGSIAHAKMLNQIGMLTNEELQDAIDGLNEIKNTIVTGQFKIEEGVEDVHSQIEFLLTKSKGEVGKKIHSGRSRNDQALVDIKLYLRSEIKAIAHLTKNLFHTLITFSNKHKADLMPGYTHLQLAMPSSFGLWFGAYAESLSDDLELLIAAYNVANKNPLGSGAGYGSSLPLNRQKTTDLLQFKQLNYNVVYAQMTRGKTEKITAMALATIGATLSKMSMDICLYLNQNFSFISFPSELTTGSSIMPHKKNPDVFELIRAKCNIIQALPNTLTLVLSNLPSGYHRDLQLTKEQLFPTITSLKDCLEMANFMLQFIEVEKDLLQNEKYKYLFTVEAVNNLALSGMPFRDAYKKIGTNIAENNFEANFELYHTHEGSIGNLCNDEITKLFNENINRIIK